MNASPNHEPTVSDPQTPDWVRDAVFYQIFPDRFAQGDPALHVADGEWSLRGHPTRRRPFGAPPLPYAEARNLDFYGGDLVGVAQRIPHLERLGATGVFLNPIWPALSNHRYDLIDHARVDPHLGGDGALAALSAALHARGMRLLLDAVINHTGSGHPWFNRDGAGEGGAYRDPDSPTRGFYRFDEWPHRYRSWLGHDTLPRLDLQNARLRELIFSGEDSFLRRFLRPPFSVDGYRFDVANMMGREGDVQHHRELWTALSLAIRETSPEAWIVGEHYFDPEKLLKGDGLDGVMAYHAFTFPLRTWLVSRDRRNLASGLDAGGLAAHLREAWARSGWPFWRRSLLHVNTHDVPRLQTLAGADGAGALEVATVVQLGSPGVPCLYYGDEIGLEGGADPDNRRCMEWDESRWDKERLARTAALVRERRQSPSLRRGGFVDLGSAGDVLAFARPHPHETRVVIASRASEALRVALDLRGLDGARRDRLEVELLPRSACIVPIG